MSVRKTVLSDRGFQVNAWINRVMWRGGIEPVPPPTSSALTHNATTVLTHPAQIVIRSAIAIGQLVSRAWSSPFLLEVL